MLNTSCSLLHVPCTLSNRVKLPESYKKHFAFAEEKLEELAQLRTIRSSHSPNETAEYKDNAALHSEPRIGSDSAVKERTAALTDRDFIRLPTFEEREKVQKARFKLPLFPTTTIGSFPQTADVKAARTALRKGELSTEDYEQFISKKITDCVALQEDITWQSTSMPVLAVT